MSEHPSKSILLEEKQRVYRELDRVKTDFAQRGWFPGTSGNLSMRVGEFAPEQFTFAVTASGKDKAASTPDDFLLVDEKGAPCEPTALKPSAETLIHCEIYRQTGCGAIFHIHSVYNSLVSELFWDRKSVPVEGVELIKAFNIWDEEAVIEVPIVSNFANIPLIVPEVRDRLDKRIPGILLRKHGIYAWGRDAFEARKHLEAFEFLFEYVYKLKLFQGRQ